MIRATLCCLVLACTAPSSVPGADFPFAARVDVLPSIAVFESDSAESTTLTPTLTLHGLQDQCLDVVWRDGVERPDAPPQGPIRLDRTGRARIDRPADAAPGPGTLQINLN